MSPTRRQFLYTVGAGSAAALYVTRLPFDDGAQLPTTVQFVDAHGLPPTTRMEDVQCIGCGDRLGQIVVDEMDRLGSSGGFACRGCFSDKLSEVEDMAAEKEDLKEDEFHNESLREDLEVELEEARTESREAKRKLKLVEGIAERLRWQLVDLRTAPFPPVRQIERMEEALDALLRAS